MPDEEHLDTYIVIRSKYGGSICKECMGPVGIGSLCVYNKISKNIRHWGCGEHLIRKQRDHPEQQVRCPRCKVMRGQACLTSTGKPAKASHLARYHRLMELRQLDRGDRPYRQEIENDCHN